jgi:hypothetical protein
VGYQSSAHDEVDLKPPCEHRSNSKMEEVLGVLDENNELVKERRYKSRNYSLDSSFSDDYDAKRYLLSNDSYSVCDSQNDYSLHYQRPFSTFNSSASLARNDNLGNAQIITQSTAVFNAKEFNMQLKPMVFSKPQLGYRGVLVLAHEIGKCVQRIKDDLFVVKFNKFRHLPEQSSSSDNHGTASNLVSIGPNSCESKLRKRIHCSKASSFLRKLNNSTCLAQNIAADNNTVDDEITNVSTHDPLSISARISLCGLQADTSDPDPVMHSPLMDSRHTFLEVCQFRHFQFDSLRRAKYSSLMLLYHLHNPGEKSLRPTCSYCREQICDLRWHCDQCAEFDICGVCFDKIGAESKHGRKNNTRNRGKQQRELLNDASTEVNEGIKTKEKQHMVNHWLTPFRVTFV